MSSGGPTSPPSPTRTTASAVARVEREPVVSGHDGRPAAIDEPTDELEGRRNRQPRRGVERPLPVELGAEARSGTDHRVGAVRDRPRPDAALPVAPNVEESRSLRRADPLVEVARVVGRAQPVEIERDHPRGMGAVDERVDSPLRQGGDEPLDRQDEGRRARDVTDDERAASARLRPTISARRRRRPTGPGTAAARR